mmetsp:Transcript_8411/g.20179  ORF Transcript_8411/g.20179 Transcript_8411/m.20179 type:complete len:315 (+) Transcript_8411:696-1640(+)
MLYGAMPQHRRGEGKNWEGKRVFRLSPHHSRSPGTFTFLHLPLQRLFLRCAPCTLPRILSLVECIGQRVVREGRGRAGESHSCRTTALVPFAKPQTEHREELAGLPANVQARHAHASGEPAAAGSASCRGNPPWQPPGSAPGDRSRKSSRCEADGAARSEPPGASAFATNSLSVVCPRSGVPGAPPSFARWLMRRPIRRRRRPWGHCRSSARSSPRAASRMPSVEQSQPGEVTARVRTLKSVPLSLRVRLRPRRPSSAISSARCAESSASFCSISGTVQMARKVRSHEMPFRPTSPSPGRSLCSAAPRPSPTSR